MSILDVVYASAPTSGYLIATIEIVHYSFNTIRVCSGFDDLNLTLEDDSVVTFYAGGIDVALPARDSSGQQFLTFAIDNVMGIVQQSIDAALEAGGEIVLIYRSYLSTDLTGPAEPALRMVVTGGSLEGGKANIQASYYDLLNTAWPRDRYTIDFSPGIKYIS